MGENRQVEYAVVDVETTGLDPTRDRVIDIGILLVDSTGLVQGDWSSLVNPQRPVDATFIHGLTDEDVESAPAFSLLLPRVVELLRGAQSLRTTRHSISGSSTPSLLAHDIP
ncbi:3'-5' exonuclease [Flaviflexus ciconiae]|uniref:3'-5' exonuclease n=1 Tax=Flaviflexus ciconiae TaxID=2496867 RepID=A0A3Q9G6M9_9ACTO|nr:3'-5' exonuclease [Flaviflexus ciconiae]